MPTRRNNTEGFARRYSANAIKPAGSFDQLSLPFFDDSPKVPCQHAIVTSKLLKEGLLGPFRRLSDPLFVPGGFGLVLLHLSLKVSQHGNALRNKL
jgi:hypothetical protein